jgi:hypothetical protein
MTLVAAALLGHLALGQGGRDRQPDQSNTRVTARAGDIKGQRNYDHTFTEEAQIGAIDNASKGTVVCNGCNVTVRSINGHSYFQFYVDNSLTITTINGQSHVLISAGSAQYPRGSLTISNGINGQSHVAVYANGDIEIRGATDFGSATIDGQSEVYLESRSGKIVIGGRIDGASKVYVRASQIQINGDIGDGHVNTEIRWALSKPSISGTNNGTLIQDDNWQAPTSEDLVGLPAPSRTEQRHRTRTEETAPH